MLTKDIVLGKRIMALHVGRQKAGKTIAAASIYKVIEGRIKFFDFDGRMDPVRLYYPDAPIEYDIYGPGQFDTFRREIEDLQRSCPYAAVVIDSLTSLSMTCINWQLLVKKTGGSDKKVFQNLGIQIPSWDEINVETQQISQLLDILKVLPCHVIFNAHPVERTEIVDKKGRKFSTLVAFGNKINNMVPGYFNEIYYFEVEPSLRSGEPAQRIAITSDDGIRIGGTALPIPPVIEWTNKDFYPILFEHLHQKGISVDKELKPPTITEPNTNQPNQTITIS